MIKLREIRKFRTYLRYFDRELYYLNSNICSCNISTSQCHLLMELENQDNITVNDLVDRLFLDKSTISRLIESLVDSGLLERIPSNHNRRSFYIKLTQNGKEICNEINKENDNFFTEVLNEIPEPEFQSFLNSFSIMVIKVVLMNEKRRINIKDTK